MKSHHRILGDEQTRIFRFQREFHLLFEQKPRVRHAIAHFDEILEREIRDGVGIRLSCPFEFGQSGPWRSKSSRKSVQSSKAQFIPCPKKGTMAWAASPSNSTFPPTCQG